MCDDQKEAQSFSLLRLLVLFLVLASVGCDSKNSDDLLFTMSFTIEPPASEALPAASRNIDRSAWSVAATIGSQEINLTPSDDYSQWTATNIEFMETNPTLNLIWRYDGLLAADFSTVIETEGLLGMTEIGPKDYRTTGTEFDEDADGFSNLTELLSGFDPRSEQDPKQNTFGVSIPFVSSADAPPVDGLYEEAWLKGSNVNWSGNGLRIDNLMVDGGADRPDGQTEFNWSAVHDGEYLYMVVYGENAETATLQSDSWNFWRDDNLNLVIDGDNSKGQSYDGINDYNWLIPLLDIIKPAPPYTDFRMETDENDDIIRDSEGNIAIQLDGVITYVPPGPYIANSSLGDNPSNRITTNVRSANSQVDIQFKNCLCELGQHIWELKIKISDLGIKIGRAFGLELQLDNDVDGKDREARYGWYHPSREFNTDTDNSWHNPSFTGTALLLRPGES